MDKLKYLGAVMEISEDPDKDIISRTRSDCPTMIYGQESWTLNNEENVIFTGRCYYTR